MVRFSTKTASTIAITLLITILLIPIGQSRDTTPPTIITIAQSATAIHPSDTIRLCAKASDDTALSWAYLVTNETGVWQPTSSWWNSDWTRSIKITVDHTKVAGTLTNFPLLVKITNTDFPIHAQPNGADFVFTDPTNTTQYPHEIDSYDLNSSTLIAWVCIPRLSTTQDTTLYLYYGNPTCPDQEHCNETWSDYLLVYHFSNNIINSCNNTYSIYYENPRFDIGKIGSSINLIAKPSIFDHHFRLITDTSYTVSAWILPQCFWSTSKAIYYRAWQWICYYPRLESTN